jgi:hypothetical protein
MSTIEAIIVTVIGGVVAGVILLWIQFRTGIFSEHVLPVAPSRTRVQRAARRSSQSGHVSGDDIKTAVDAVVSDSSKEEVVSSMAPGLRNGQLTGDEIEAILRSFVSDSSKEAALETLVSKARRPVPGASQARIVALFCSSTSQAAAARLMGD